MSVLVFDGDPEELEPGGEQDGVTRIINGEPHLYGCVANSTCYSNTVLVCDCTCHDL